jgi:hypothetical protein
MEDDHAAVGKTSLRCAILGVVAAVGLAALAAVTLATQPARALGVGPAAAVALGGVVLVVVLEVVALGCGLAARHTATGKAGLALAGACLLMVAGLVVVALFGLGPW